MTGPFGLAAMMPITIEMSNMQFRVVPFRPGMRQFIQNRRSKLFPIHNAFVVRVIATVLIHMP